MHRAQLDLGQKANNCCYVSSEGGPKSAGLRPLSAVLIQWAVLLLSVTSRTFMKGPRHWSTCGGPRLAGGTAIQSRLQVSISCRNCRGCQSKALTPGLHCTRGGCRTARERRIYLQKSLQGAMFPMKTVPLASVPSTCHTDVIPRDAQPSWFQRDRSHMLRTAHRRTKGT